MIATIGSFTRTYVMNVELQQSAQIVLDRMKEFLRRDHGTDLPRPQIIEFTGTPVSGKTTCINSVDDFLRRSGFRVMRPQEGAEAVRGIPRDSPRYNIATGIYALQIVLGAMYDRNHDVVLLDRGLHDAHAWMLYWQYKNQLIGTDKQMFQQFFSHPLYLNAIDTCFYIFCGVDEVNRRKQEGFAGDYRPTGKGSFTSPEAIELLHTVFTASLQDFALSGNTIAMDTTKLTKAQMFNVVYAVILAHMDRRSFKQKRTTHTAAG